jgi:carbonic anhydrase
MSLGQLLENNRSWARGQPLEVRGWIYDLKDGLLRDLQVTQSGSNA